MGDKTLDQRRANHAYLAVKNVVKSHGKGEKAKKFGGQAKKLSIRIIASGLGQALAFLQAKGYAPYLLVVLGDWVLNKRQTKEDQPPPVKEQCEKEQKELLLRIIALDADFLRRATDEVLVYLQWLNRFAEAEGLTEGED